MKKMQIFALFLLAFTFPANAENDLRLNIEIQSRIIPNFSPSEPDRTVFDKLEYLGGIELYSNNDHFGGYSGFRFYNGRTDFISISDMGFWMGGTIERKDGLPVAIKNAHIAPMRDSDGNIMLGKSNSDAEALEIVGDQIYLAFERKHRVEIHDLDFSTLRGTSKQLTNKIGKLGLRGNKGLEAIASPPAGSPLEGKLILFSERTLNKNKDIRAFILDQGKLEEFSVTRPGKFDITDAKFTDNGDLILLERRFSPATGAAMRLRRFKPGTIKAGARLIGETLMFAGMSAQIDNMEGLDITKAENGDTILTLISDDNHSILQRTILLEFKLLD